ncbi:hypothetical protein KZZ07_16495 [Mameliella sp. CS4]|uniref:hypothetical protein n=1 Tax=Mameliella sp. CS4 TaxID=2862329 RepID=UPI001C5EF160|nr:hypothetical protein [Mameliella sp. CS4]MBW4984144.1 hypothetical protein [Mameliella sp. CS4]
MALTTTKTPRAVLRGTPVSANYQPDPAELETVLDEVIDGAASDTDLTALDTRVSATETGKADTSVTDALDVRITDLEAAAGDFALQGGWDASSGAFPSGATAMDLWEVETAGTVDGVTFAVGDQIVALVNSASTTTYAANWFQRPAATVLSVAGKTGAVALDVTDVADAASEAYVDASVADVSVDSATSYSDAAGSGDRTAVQTASVSSGLLASGSASNLIDGASSTGVSDGIAFNAVTATGHYLRVMFPAGAQKYLTEVTITQSGTQSHGTWKLQVTYDGTTWTDAGSAATLGGATSQAWTSDSAFKAVRGYQLLGVSGTTSASPFIWELTAKVVSAPGDGVLTYDPIGDMPASLRAKLEAAYLLNAVDGSTLYPAYGGAEIDLSAPASQSYDLTALGIRLTGGVLRLPTNSVIGSTVIMRAPVDGLGSGFVVEGPSGSGPLGTAGKGFGPDASASSEKVMAAGQSWRDTRALFDYGLDRGTWAAHHRERASALTAGLAVGGRYTVDTSRVTEMEVAVVLLWTSALDADDLVALGHWVRRYMARHGVSMHFDDCQEERDVYIGIGDSMMEGVDLVANLPAAYSALSGSCVEIVSSAGGGNDAVRLLPFDHWGSGHEEAPTDTLATVKTSLFAGLVAARTLRARNVGPCYALNLGKGSSYATPSSITSNSSLSWNVSELRSSAGLYHTALRTIEWLFGVMAERGHKPSGTIYVMISLGLNDAVSTTMTSDAATFQARLQAILDEMESDLPYPVEVLMMRAHADDPASDATALGYVRTGTDAFIAANANVMLYNNDAQAYIADGVHNTAAVMVSQGETFEALRS